MVSGNVAAVDEDDEWQKIRAAELEAGWGDIWIKGPTARREYLQKVLDRAITGDEMAVVSLFVMRKDMRVWREWIAPLRELEMAVAQNELDRARREGVRIREEANVAQAETRASLEQMLTAAEAEGNSELADEIRAIKTGLAFQDRVERDWLVAEERLVADHDAAEAERLEAEESVARKQPGFEERREKLDNALESWRKSARSTSETPEGNGRLKKRQGRRMQNAGMKSTRSRDFLPLSS